MQFFNLAHMKINSKKRTEQVLFGSKWLLTFFYFGLIVGQISYAYVYGKEIYHLLMGVNEFGKSEIMLALLELVDMVMIANLIKMIITGSYNSSVAKDHGFPGENTSSGTMKVKMSTSLVGVTSIHLLQTFIGIGSEPVLWDDIYKKCLIHAIFVLGSIALAYIEYLHDKGDALNPHDNDGVVRTKEEEDEETKKLKVEVHPQNGVSIEHNH